MIKILFICHGNICRSTMAEFVMKHLVDEAGLTGEIIAASAATSREEIGNDTHHGTKRKLTEMGIPFTKRAAVQVTMADYDTYDYLICMDRNNLRNLEPIIGPDRDKKVSLLLSFAGSPDDIADPWFTGNFDATYNDVLQGCTALLEKIKAGI